MSRPCARKSRHCASVWEMRRARQQRRLRFLPALFKKGETAVVSAENGRKAAAHRSSGQASRRTPKEHDVRLTRNAGVSRTRPGSTIRRIVATGIFVALSLAMPKPAKAGRLGEDIIALFPK